MPKMKTHKGTAKRFGLTGTGKLRRMKHNSSHLRRNKSKRAKRQFDQTLPVSKADDKRIRRLLPYGV